MPTKRTRVSHNLIPRGVEPEILWELGDEVLYPKPQPFNRLTHFIADFGAAWKSAREQILTDWIRQFPGSRPSYWWHHDREAPQISLESIALLGRSSRRVGLYPNEFCEPRKRLGGIGTPKFEVLNYGVTFHLGIPDLWVDAWETAYYNGRKTDIHGNRIGTKYHEGNFAGVPIDPKNPPRFEAQAVYLERHGLLLEDEKQRLHKKDWEPEVVEFAEEQELSTTWPVTDRLQ